MLTDQEVLGNRNKIIQLLVETNRAGVMPLLEWLEDGGFFRGPASTRHHGCYTGGLAAHSLNVFNGLIDLMVQCTAEVRLDSAVIACLLHDACKLGAYTGSEAPYGRNKEQPAGHALLSISRIERFVSLTPQERRMIQFHMGVFGTREFSAESGEYGNGEFITQIVSDRAVQLIGIADQLAALQEGAEELAYNLVPQEPLR